MSAPPAPPARAGATGATLEVAGAVVRAGTTSWAGRELVRAGGFYPKKTMTAAQRLAFYAGRFALAEIATTHAFPPTPELCRQWAERTPEGFRFDVRAWSLLTGAPTMPDSLYADLHDQVRPGCRGRRRLYPSHLSAGALEECWSRFARALRPLAAADRLGTVILRYPTWVSPRPESWAGLAAARSRLDGYAVAVELTNPRWFEGSRCDDTLEWLEDHDLGFVCVDGPDTGARAGPSVVAATSPVAVVRFTGRRAVAGEPWTWPYRYTTEELRAWLPRVHELAASCDEVHLLMDNPWRTDAVDNALELLALLGPTGP